MLYCLWTRNIHRLLFNKYAFNYRKLISDSLPSTCNKWSFNQKFAVPFKYNGNCVTRWRLREPQTSNIQHSRYDISHADTHTRAHQREKRRTRQQTWQKTEKWHCVTRNHVMQNENLLVYSTRITIISITSITKSIWINWNFVHGKVEILTPHFEHSRTHTLAYAEW